MIITPLFICIDYIDTQIYVKQRLNVDFYGFNILENNIVKLSLKTYNMPIILVSFVYVKHICHYCIGFTNSLKEAINKFNLTTDLIGDMNIYIIGVPTNNYDFLDFLNYLVLKYFK